MPPPIPIFIILFIAVLGWLARSLAQFLAGASCRRQVVAARMLLVLARLVHVRCEAASRVVAGELGVVAEGVALEQGRIAIVTSVMWPSQQLV